MIRKRRTDGSCINSHSHGFALELVCGAYDMFIHVCGD